MPDRPLSLSATCALLILMAEDREISNPELKEKHGITVTGKERTALNAAGFVESRRKGRSYAHVVTDKGWHHASLVFESGFPSGTGFAAAALGAVVSVLGRYMRRTDNALADIFAGQDVLLPPAGGSAAEPAGGSVAGSATAQPVPSAGGTAAPPPAPGEPAADIETRIRKAYARLAGKAGAWVSLTRLRPLLGDAARDDVDAALRRMIALPDVRLVPWESQKSLSQADREAAVVIGDQPKHMISIGA